MAKKRMFDRAIIDTDRFMDLSMSSKALYFLLGMEADDEGFVSYKKVMRVHGGNEDDIKVLTAKEFIIMFDSGVVVITDWNKNNYLDRNRMSDTEYQKEKRMLSLTDTKEYVFNSGLTYVKPEEKRREEKRITGMENLPEWLDREKWQEWISYRHSRKLTCVKTTMEKQIAFLEKHLADHVEIIEKSIASGWQGLFPLKREITSNNALKAPNGKYDKYTKKI